MPWKNEVFQNFNLYAVTSISSEQEGEQVLEKIDAVYRGGADILQLRAKGLSDQALIRLGRKIRRLADQYRKLYFMNDRVDLALCTDADGLHLGQEDLPITEARKLASASGRELFIGVSTHRMEEAQKAVQDGADYIGVGPVYKTPTKPGQEAVGLSYIQVVSQSLSLPFVAIGGIDLNHLQEVIQAGASRIAVVRALFDQEDSYDAAKNFKERIQEYTRAKFTV